MSSKKKPRPLFEVPVEIGSGHESGWVYRSGAAEPAPHDDFLASPDLPDAGIAATSAGAVALTLAAVAQTFILGVTLAVIPITIGIHALQSLARPDETR